MPTAVNDTGAESSVLRRLLIESETLGGLQKCRELHVQPPVIAGSEVVNSSGIKISHAVITKEQTKDPMISRVMQWLTVPGILPERAVVVTEDPDIQHLLVQNDSLQVKMVF